MMFEGQVTTDANGLILYDPLAFRSFYSAQLEDGTNFIERYTHTNEGDRVLRSGIVVPLIAIDDDTYSIQVAVMNNLKEAAPALPGTAVCVNRFYPLIVQSIVLVADAAQLIEWSDKHALHGLQADVPPGKYRVEVVGFRSMSDDETVIVDAGYRFNLWPTRRLCQVTAKTDADMRVLKHPGADPSSVRR